MVELVSLDLLTEYFEVAGVGLVFGILLPFAFYIVAALISVVQKSTR